MQNHKNEFIDLKKDKITTLGKLEISSIYSDQSIKKTWNIPQELLCLLKKTLLDYDNLDVIGDFVDRSYRNLVSQRIVQYNETIQL